MNTLESLIWWTEEYRKEVAKRQLAEEELKVEKHRTAKHIMAASEEIAKLQRAVRERATALRNVRTMLDSSPEQARIYLGEIEELIKPPY